MYIYICQKSYKPSSSIGDLWHEFPWGMGGINHESTRHINIYIYMQYLNKDSPIQGLSSLPTDLPEDWPMAWSAWASASDPPTQRPRPQPVPRTHRGNLCAAASWCCCRAGRRIQGQNVGKKLYIVKMWGLNSSEPCWSEVLIPYIYILTVYI